MTQSSPAGVRLPGGSSAEESDQQRVHQLSSFQVRQMTGLLDRMVLGLPEWPLALRGPDQRLRGSLVSTLRLRS